MKKLFIFISTIFFLQSISWAQSCLPEGIVFSNQASINNFQSNYPGCIEIEGDVTISGINITNLNGLDILTSIGGSLKITHNDPLTSLIGLNNLTNIGGGLMIDTNVVLSSLSALSNIEYVGGGIRVAGNTLLTSIEIFSNLTVLNGNLDVEYNHGLNNMVGFENLTNINGSLFIYGNYSLLSLSGLESLDTIQGSLIIMWNSNLTSLDPLYNLTFVNGDLNINHNYDLISIAGISQVNPLYIDNLTICENDNLSDCEVESVCGYLANPAGSINIYGNHTGCKNPRQAANSCGVNLECLPYGNYYFISQNDINNFSSDYPGCCDLKGNVIMDNIYDLNGLDCVTTISGDLNFTECYMTQFSGLENLAFVGGNFLIMYCNGLTGMIGLSNLDTIGGGLTFSENQHLSSVIGLGRLKSIGGDLYFRSNENLSSMIGFDSLSYVGGTLSIINQDYFIDLADLGNVTHFGGGLEIRENDNLTSLTGLEVMTSIQGDLNISYNESLVDLEGLKNVTSIDGKILIYDNWDLNSLSDLENLTSIGGDLMIEANTSLTDLIGLENIDAATIGDLILKYNNLLSECDVNSICDYLSNPNGTIDIYGNKTGCNSLEEIMQACAVNVPTSGVENKVLIFPNPAYKMISIISSNELSISEISIYNKLGQKVFSEKNRTGYIDVSFLEKGIYILDLCYDRGNLKQKLIVQ